MERGQRRNRVVGQWRCVLHRLYQDDAECVGVLIMPPTIATISVRSPTRLERHSGQHGHHVGPDLTAIAVHRRAYRPASWPVTAPPRGSKRMRSGSAMARLALVVPANDAWLGEPRARGPAVAAPRHEPRTAIANRGEMGRAQRRGDTTSRPGTPAKSPAI
jgi:hypothetical protein